MRWKTRLLWVAFLGLTSVAYLAALQFALATFFPAPIIPKGQSLYRTDDHLGWRLIPNKESGRTRVGRVFLEEKVNSAGFRDVERSPAKPKGAIRIVVLGDSFCDQLEIPLRQLFPHVLETKLNFQRSISVEVINLGVAGFGTAQAYLAFKHHGAQYRPDLIILAFFIGNDVYDNSAEWQAQHQHTDIRRHRSSSSTAAT
jgi:hypothetical protein